ncbi:MAG: DUF4178 domain-containing protein [Polyangiaceae bacterium]
MATATSTCPNCGAPIEFALGSSLAKVCEYCRHTVVRSDRGLQGLGQVADLALTPALIAVGDEGTLGEQALRVLGRVQLDHGLGPWDEYFVALDNGQSFAWLAYAQGQWFITSAVADAPPPDFESLSLERELRLAGRPFFVAEIKRGQVLSIEGEFQELIRPGAARRYADCWGPQNSFATIDYGQQGDPVSMYTGWAFPEPALHISALGPRSTHKIKSTTLRCPHCGGDIPKLAGERAERVGCPYCGVLSDIAEQRIISAQEQRRAAPAIPVGNAGTLNGVSYTCIAYLRRGARFEGEPYAWEEFLLWSQPIGFRWLVSAPEAGWAFVTPVNLADVDRRGFPERLGLEGRAFQRRNQSEARVEYVLGEVYWKCSVGESTAVIDYVDGDRVLSRETGNGEVHYSLSTPIAWPVLAHAFGVLPGSPGAFTGQSPNKRGCVTVGCFAVAILLFVLFIVFFETCGSAGGGVGSSYRGTGVFYGGK